MECHPNIPADPAALVAETLTSSWDRMRSAHLNPLWRNGFQKERAVLYNIRTTSLFKLKYHFQF